MRRVLLLVCVLSFVVMAVAVYAAGPLHTWKIVGVPTQANGYTALIWENGFVYSSKPLSPSTRTGLFTYFAIDNDEQMMRRQFQGDDVDQTLVQLAKWAANMTASQKLDNVIAKGILTFDSFTLPKGMVLSSAKDFHGHYLDRDRYAYIDERVKVLSNFTCELGAAKPSSFNNLPDAKVFDTFAVNETVKILESVTPMGMGSITTSRSTSVKVHRFAIVADCPNAVRFDIEKISEDEMNGTGPTLKEALQADTDRKGQLSEAVRPITLVR